MNARIHETDNHPMTEIPLRIAVLRVLTLDDPEQVALHGRVIEQHFPGVETTSDCIPGHPEGLPNPAAEAEALPAIRSLGEDLAADADVLAISCALDPAVDDLRSTLDIPVIGAGAAVAASALTRGRRVGVLALEDGCPPAVEAVLGEHLHATELVEGAETTNFLTTAAGQEAITNAVERLKAAGCDVVAPACTGVTTAGILPAVRAEVGIDVVDPVVAMGAMAYAAGVERQEVPATI